ncbi:MAG: hypothetical protein OXU27_10170 [Candidatus Poribacteria bacterium]|nr:hypothetical protein [Candidatus Poribacteria bacterium]
MIKKRTIRFLPRLWILAIFTIVLGSGVQAQTIETVIPADSFLYLKLQNLADCRGVMETSDSWKTASDIITDSHKWLPVHQLMQTLPTFAGTDMQGIFKTFLGDKIALTLSPGAEGVMIGLVIQNAGKTQEAEQTLSKFISTLAGMGNKVSYSEGDYRNTHYHTVQINEQQFSYGSVSDFFLIGSPLDSFKKMVDVYETQEASIANNTTYLSVVETYRNSEFFAFVDVTTAAPYLKLLLPPIVARELEAFKTVSYSWKLLREGGGLRMFGQLKGGTEASLIPRLKTAARLQTTQGLSGTEDFFVALAPSMAPIFWQVFLADFSSELRSFLFPSAIDWQAALAGELTVSIDFSSVFTNLRKNSQQLRYIVDKPDGTHIESVNIDFPPENIGILLRPDAPEELQTVFNGFLEKTSFPARRQQVDYKGITMNIDSIPGTLYYGNINDFFLIAFSEKQFKTMVDNLLDKTHTSDLPERLALIAAPPAGVIHFNLGSFARAMVIATPWMTQEAAAPVRQIGAHLMSLVVQEETAWLDIAHAPDETGIEVVAKLAPSLFLFITEQLKLGQ